MISSKTTVCVTGATGFIASWVIKQLLEKGYKVKGSCRDPTNAKKVQHLKSMKGDLELFKADLMTPGAFDDAIQGCDYVMHMASPYIIDVTDPQKELVDPAINGTLNVMKAAKAAGVKRVVLTSSMAAITDEPIKKYTEADWNTKSSLTRNPYYFSKVEAEKAGWKYAKDNDMDLVVINPFVVIGPALNTSLNESNKILKNIMMGGMPAILHLGWGMVDVRDVAKAHVLAMEKEDASGRYLTCNETVAMRDVVQLLKTNYPKYKKIPTLNLDCKSGATLTKFMANFEKKGMKDYIKTNVGKFPEYDNSKVKGLGVEFREINESILDTVADLISHGHITPPGSKKKN